MDTFGISQNPYDQYDAYDAAEQHYLKRADRGHSRRQDQLRTKPQRTRRTPQVGNMSQRRPSAAQEAQMNASQPRRTGSQRRTQLPQTTYSPFPAPKPLIRKPVSRPVSRGRTDSPSRRNDSPSRPTDSPNSVLSFVSSDVPTSRYEHHRSRPFDLETPARPGSSSRPASRNGSSPRPSSPGGSIFQHFSLSRRGSNASGTSDYQRPGSRRGSFSESLRRASNDFRKGIEIVKMDEEARSRWRVSEKARLEDEIEEARRQDPSSRPAYQQEYLSWKAKRTPNPKPEMDAHERTIALDKALRDGTGKKKLEAQKERDMNAPLTAGEEIALLIAKSLDPVRKRRRQGSDDSGMDFADCGAPLDVMESCKRCGRPVGRRAEEGLWLIDGYCPRCHRLRTQEFWDTDSASLSDADSAYSTSPKPTSPRREVDEEEYMKIRVNKRIRRVRRTIYEDPGNPFLIFDFEEEDLDVNDAPPPGFWGPGDVSPAFCGPSRHVSTKDEFDRILGSAERQSHDMEDARDSPMHAPTPRRTGTPTLIKEHSIAVALEPDASQREGLDGVPEWGLSQKKADTAPPEQSGGTRDTMFYGFYDNVLQEYRRSLNRK